MLRFNKIFILDDSRFSKVFYSLQDEIFTIHKKFTSCEILEILISFTNVGIMDATLEIFKNLLEREDCKLSKFLRRGIYRKVVKCDTILEIFKNFTECEDENRKTFLSSTVSDSQNPKRFYRL